ncbi:MAG: hypothetical protein CMJ83_11855 [Planctomycetes bacterium]|nr:hypothetical protein [Planctomycetota bacterium]
MGSPDPYVKNKELPINPIASVGPLPVPDEKKRKRRRALREDEVHVFLRTARAEDERRLGEGRGMIPQLPLWALLVERGSRWQETVKLRWCDVDLDGGWAVFRAEVTKNKKQRTVSLPKALCPLLSELRGVHARISGHPPFTDDLVFLRPNGSAWFGPKDQNDGGGRELFYATLKAAGIARSDVRGSSVDIHALRGTAVTRMLRAGVPYPTVEKIVGADIRILLRHYEDLQPEDLRDDLERMNTAIPGTLLPPQSDMGTASA